mmetsp:Transcript_7244/g.13401  ORF Transcript_7244/g.13401 Transcript_7244/m.13401 type:complete len:280 (+) Transcript_7244:132-971(+)
MPGKLYFVSDTNGQFLMIFTWVCIVYVVAVTLNFLVPQKLEESRGMITNSYLALTLLAFISHLRCSFTHPGPVKPESASKSAEICKVCKNPKPERVHHCKTCKVCILLMDHHCPFVNNCVGAANQKFFLLFCGYISLAAFYTVCLAAITAWDILFKPDTVFRMWVLLLGLLATVIAGFFFFLVAVLLVKQVGRILRNRTYIEELKSKTGAPITFKEAFTQTFGDDPFLFCLIPTTPSLQIKPFSPTKDAPQFASKWEDAMIIGVPLASVALVIGIVSYF